MIEQRGRVIDLLPAAKGQPQRLRIEVARRSACSGCAQASGCGTGAMAGLFGERALQLELPAPSIPGGEGASVSILRRGDDILLGIEPRALLGAALLTYLLPALLMLLGAGLGARLGGDALSALLGVLALLGGLVLSRLLIGRRAAGDGPLLASVVHARAEF